MDYVLNVCDTLFFDRFFATIAPIKNYAPVVGAAAGAFNTTKGAWELDPVSDYITRTGILNLVPTEYANMSYLARDDWRRMFFSLWFITYVFGFILYFITATLSYIFVFDKRTFDHPKFLKHQMRQEIITTLGSLPWMAVFTAPWFLAEIKGYGKLYYDVDAYPRWWMFAQFPVFIAFTDCFIYLIHRGLHHPILYRRLHKPHHKWIMPTPYASHAFHPVDGYAQSLPYHIFPFIFPLHKFSYLFLFVFINIWTVLIHDGEYMADHPAINGAACHTMHHLYFNYNYGQFTTLWDRLGGSYRKPDEGLFDKEKKMAQDEWKKQVKGVERVMKEVEGDDDREYGKGDTKKTR